MNKQDLFNTFHQKISMKAIGKWGEDYCVIGKFCVIAPLSDNKFDLWICNPTDLTTGLGTGKMRNISAVFKKSAVKSTFTELTGESYMTVRGTGLILENLRVLGIRKKREVSAEQAGKMKDQMSAARTRLKGDQSCV